MRLGAQDQGNQHSVTADDNTFDSCLLGAGSKFAATFTKAGDFKYHCLIHGKTMSGTVVVKAAEK